MKAEPCKATIKYWKQCYQTPDSFFRYCERDLLPLFDTPTVKRRFFTLDVCAEPWNAKCHTFIAPPGTMECDGMVGTDGLKTSWETSGAAWCNPGFSNCLPWARQARRQQEAGYLSFMLTHASHAAKWSQWTIKHASACILINPRINFPGDPRYVNYLALQNKKLPGNNRDSMLWVFDPAHEGPCRFINPEPWRIDTPKKKAA